MFSQVYAFMTYTTFAHAQSQSSKYVSEEDTNPKHIFSNFFTDAGFVWIGTTSDPYIDNSLIVFAVKWHL